MFIADIIAEIGARPEGMWLDRRDNSRGYEQGNVQWATPVEQARNRRPRGFLTALAVSVAAFSLLASVPAQAQAHPAAWYGNAALDWAEAHAAGHPYQMGGTGPWAYDCSGLVQQAFAHAGVALPRTTYQMLASPHVRLFWTSHPWRGLIAFYGSGHVEIVTGWHDQTFGAHDYGQPVGWITWGQWWHPTIFGEVTP